MTDTLKAWHFVGDRLRDGRPIPKDGAWLKHSGRVQICRCGLHASRRPWHALEYAPGAVLCYVECRGDIHEQDDKLVCRERRILTRADLTETLRFFARMQALSVAHLWDVRPPDVVLDYLMTGEESIRGAAWAVARDAAWAVARAAAWRASRAAARNAAWRASRAAARNAAWAAAWNAVREVAQEAAQEAAWKTAWNAGRKATGEEFDTLVHEQFGVVV